MTFEQAVEALNQMVGMHVDLEVRRPDGKRFLHASGRLATGRGEFAPRATGGPPMELIERERSHFAVGASEDACCEVTLRRSDFTRAEWQPGWGDGQILSLDLSGSTTLRVAARLT